MFQICRKVFDPCRDRLSVPRNNRPHGVLFPVSLRFPGLFAGSLSISNDNIYYSLGIVKGIFHIFSIILHLFLPDFHTKLVNRTDCEPARRCAVLNLCFRPNYAPPHYIYIYYVYIYIITTCILTCCFRGVYVVFRKTPISGHFLTIFSPILTPPFTRSMTQFLALSVRSQKIMFTDVFNRNAYRDMELRYYRRLPSRESCLQTVYKSFTP